MATFKQMTDFFQEVGATEVTHSTKSYLAHAIGVRSDLMSWGRDDDFSNIGLFHSIYGTELFQGFVLPLEQRHEVQKLIGDRAEWLSYLNCAIDRSHFDNEIQKDSGPYEFHDRFTDEIIAISNQDFDDLCTVHLCDWIEQVARSKAWDYRRKAYGDLAARMGGVGKTRYEDVFRDAPEQLWFDEYDWPQLALR